MTYKYNGNKKDRIRYKTSNFSLVFIGGLIIFCAGIYLMFFHFRPRPIGIQKYEAIFIFVLGIVLIIASPFAFIFSKMNAKFDGEIMFNIKKDESNPDYQLNVTGYKKEKLCKEEQSVYDCRIKGKQRADYVMCICGFCRIGNCSGYTGMEDAGSERMYCSVD